MVIPTNNPNKKLTKKIKQSSKTIKRPRNASIQAQKEWLKMPQKLKKELRKNLTDTDHDGTPNGFDCHPKDRRRQEAFLPEDSTWMRRNSKRMLTGGSILGQGTNGVVQRMKNNKNLILKTELEGEAWSPVDEEGSFFRKHKLTREPLFIPTKTIQHGSKTMLIKPVVKPIVEPGYYIHSNTKQFLTDSKLSLLHKQLTILSYKGYCFNDGLQLGKDRAGRILQFDLGAIKRIPVSKTKISDIPFKINNAEWKALLHKLRKSESKFGEIKRIKLLDTLYLNGALSLRNSDKAMASASINKSSVNRSMKQSKSLHKKSCSNIKIT